MPIRAFKCDSCGKTVDELYWSKYPKSIKCPNCEGRATYRFVDTHYERWGDRQPKRYKFMFRDGYDPGAGKYFSTQKDRDTWLRETNSTFRKDCF
jgi:putative FmdB family regulatory protein